jgi:hypothetical protein
LISHHLLGTYLRDHLKNGFNLVDRLLNSRGQLTSKLLVLLQLLALFDLFLGLFWLLWLWLRDVFNESDMAKSYTLRVDDITISIDLLAGNLGDIAFGELRNYAAIVVDDVAILVYFAIKQKELVRVHQCIKIAR